jgi:hypothetical protein
LLTAEAVTRREIQEGVCFMEPALQYLSCTQQEIGDQLIKMFVFQTATRDDRAIKGLCFHGIRLFGKS